MLETLPSGPPELVRLVESLRPSDKETADLCPVSIRESSHCLYPQTYVVVALTENP